MTSEAQPGQEQRMVTDAMLEAGAAALFSVSDFEGRYAELSELSKQIYREKAYAVLNAARPTADLGEDGELIAALRKRAAWQRENRGDMLDYGTPDPELEQAADRLILYREALEATIPALEGQVESLLRSYTNLSGPDKGKVTDPDGLAWIAEFQEPLTKVRAVLSRSGG